MTNLHYHLVEIKLRFFYLMFSTLSTFLVFYNNQIEIVYIIGKPFINRQQTFIFLELTEAFYTFLKISTILTLLVLLPFYIYHFWSFIISSFYKMERKKINFFILFFVCVLFCEIFFTYDVLLPQICEFLLSFQVTGPLSSDFGQRGPLISVEFAARIESYVEIVYKISLLLFCIFQVPIFVYFLYSKKCIHVENFYSHRKISGIVSLCGSALIVPPDMLTQLFVALFFFILFEISIFIGLWQKEFLDTEKK